MTPDLDALDLDAIERTLKEPDALSYTQSRAWLTQLVAALRGAVEDKEWLVKQKALLEGALAHAGKIADALQAEVRGAVEERDRLRTALDAKNKETQ